MSGHSCYLCGSNDLELKQIIRSKPSIETNFNIPAKNYKRKICQCNHCSVYNNFHDFKINSIYSGAYNTATYSNEILDKYNKIMGLPIEKSDNKQRVSRIIEFLKSNKYKIDQLKVLDVGSGLGVFLGQLLKNGVEAHCIDPDPLSVRHAIDNIGVKSAFLGGFEEYQSNQKFDLITFNKVLEHVTNPVELLKKAKTLLNKNGFIYLELPDGGNAASNGGFVDREEFYIEHYIIFESNSLLYLAKQARLDIDKILSIHEPSDKYTIVSFLN